MTLQNQIKAWLILFIVTILLLWLFRGILLPFIAGLGLAYLLDPLADRLEKWRFSRFWATSTILLLALLIFVGAALLVIPPIAHQAIGFAERLPGYVDRLQIMARDFAPQFEEFLGQERVAQIENNLSQYVSQGIGFLTGVVASVGQSGLALLNAVGLLIVTPVVAFYALLDWDNLVKTADSLLPRRHRDEIRNVMTMINKSMSGVIRGQASVVLLLCIFYATALTLAGLSFGIVIGLITGFLSFVPYAGLLIGLLLAVGVAIVQSWPDWLLVTIVLVIFAIGQFLEGNVLYPKLVGSSIGVHPVWLMFALFAFGLIFGFVGLLLAVPLSAVASVLMKYAVKKYRSSALYLNSEGDKGGQSPSS